MVKRRFIKPKLEVWGYCRVSTAEQSLERQRAVIFEYTNAHAMTIDRMLETKISSKKDEAKRGIPELREAIVSGQVKTIIFSELSRLARSISQIVRLVDEFHHKHGVELVFIKENIHLRPGEKQGLTSKVMLSMFSLFAEVERDLISQRVRDGMAARKALGAVYGRRPGSSKLDVHRDRIRESLAAGVTKGRLCEDLGCTRPTLNAWLKNNENSE